MTTSNDISRFQRLSAERVTALVRQYVEEFHFDVSGNTEFFLIGEISSIHLTIWIYDDELQFKCPREERLLEKPDFDEPEQMLQYFLQRLEGVLSGQIDKKRGGIR